MKQIMLVILFFGALSACAQSSPPNLILLNLNDVEVLDAVHMIDHITRLRLMRKLNELQSAGLIAPSVQNKTRKSVFCEIPADKGFVLIPVRGSLDTCQIDKIDSDSATSAALHLAAYVSAQIIDSVFQDLSKGDPDSAKTEFIKHKQNNLQLIHSLKPTKVPSKRRSIFLKTAGSLKTMLMLSVDLVPVKQ